MNVLITPQFNLAMARLSRKAQQEVARLFAMASAMTHEELSVSPLLTRIASSSEPIYTLRGGLTRIFCAFNSDSDILFLDVREVQDPSLENEPRQKGDTTLFGRSGSPTAYIAEGDGTIFSFAGEPLAYLGDQGNVYGFNGKHLGWFEDDILWDHQGRKVGFTRDTCPSFAQFEPFRGFKRFMPLKRLKQLAPLKPLKRMEISSIDLLSFLKAGEK